MYHILRHEKHILYLIGHLLLKVTKYHFIKPLLYETDVVYGRMCLK